MLNEEQFFYHSQTDWALLLSPVPAIHPVCHPYLNSEEDDMDLQSLFFDFASAEGKAM